MAYLPRSKCSAGMSGHVILQCNDELILVLCLCHQVQWKGVTVGGRCGHGVDHRVWHLNHRGVVGERNVDESDSVGGCKSCSVARGVKVIVLASGPAACVEVLGGCNGCGRQIQIRLYWCRW